MMPTGKASGNAVLAKARALYGSRLRADDYRRLMACRTMTELAAALKEYPLYSEALADVNPQYARRVQLENLLRQSLYTRYDSLCRCAGARQQGPADRRRRRRRCGAAAGDPVPRT